MGLLQAALRTYESQAHLAGVPVEGKETLTPISHTIQKAQIEIIIDEDGSFREAKPVPKAQSRTIIPVTEESAGRTSGKGRSHPLSDQLQYLSPINEDHHKAYLELLERWAQSEYSHPKVRAVLRYIQGGTILKDLCAAGVISVSYTHLDVYKRQLLKSSIIRQMWAIPIGVSKMGMLTSTRLTIENRPRKLCSSSASMVPKTI